MGYLTKSSLEEGFQTMIGSIRMIGIALSAVIAFIGILNFINSIITGILARKHEFAVLCSIGMTEQQLKRMILEESLYYVLISGIISVALGTALSRIILLALNNVIMFFAYTENPGGKGDFNLYRAYAHAAFPGGGLLLRSDGDGIFKPFFCFYA